MGAEARPDRELAIRWLAASERTRAAAIWTGLERRLGDGDLACSWDWTEVWLRHYGDAVSHRFAVGEANGEPCGIVLVSKRHGRRGPLPLRSVHLGTAGEPPGESVFVEYNRVLVDAARRPAFATALAGELRGERDWHELVLDGFAEEDAEPWLAAEPLLVAERMPCAVTDLREAGDDALGALRSSTRTKIRRSIKGLGELRAELAETPAEALAILDELIELHQRRRRSLGEPGAFASPRFTAFHRELVARLAPERAILFRVRAEGGTVGCLYAFAERGRILLYQTGVAAYEDRQIRPVFVACAQLMQAGLERGLTEFDFLAGESPHKRELSNTTRDLVWARGRRPALRWRALDALAAGRRRLRSGVAQGS